MPRTPLGPVEPGYTGANHLKAELEASQAASACHYENGWLTTLPICWMPATKAYNEKATPPPSLGFWMTADRSTLCITRINIFALEVLNEISAIRLGRLGRA